MKKTEGQRPQEREGPTLLAYPFASQDAREEGKLNRQDAENRIEELNRQDAKSAKDWKEEEEEK